MCWAAGNKPPSEKLNIAGVGVGGMGAHNLSMCSAENIVALCDVDPGYAAKTLPRYPKAKRYKDFRVMLDKQKDIDAVIVATPDHTHAVIAMAAIQRGKHVYVQKPMTHSVYEARVLTEAARKHKVVTQMGNQGHSGDGARLMCEWIADGAIGAVREVHAWTNRPVWPQGVEVGAAQGNAAGAGHAGLGPVARSGPHPPLSSRLSSRHLAGLVGLRHRFAGRPGLPHPGRALLGPEAEISRQRGRLHLDLLARPLGTDRPRRTRQYPALDHRPLQVPGPGGHAGSQADLVGRRHDAAPARRSWKRAGRWATATAACSSSATRAV